MESLAKALVGLAALCLVLAVIVALFMGGSMMQLPAESFSRASQNMALIAIAVLLMNRKVPGIGG